MLVISWNLIIVLLFTVNVVFLRFGEGTFSKINVFCLLLNWWTSLLKPHYNFIFQTWIQQEPRNCIEDKQCLFFFYSLIFVLFCLFFSFLIKIITIEWCTSCIYNIPVVGKLGTDACWHQKWFSFSVLYLSSLTSLEKILVSKIKDKFVTINMIQWHGKTIREITKWTNLSLLGVLDLIIVATKDEMIGEKIKSLSWKIQSEGVRVTVL